MTWQDELRAALMRHMRIASPRDTDAARAFDHGVNEGIRLAVATLGELAAQPGIVDLSEWCPCRVSGDGCGYADPAFCPAVDGQPCAVLAARKEAT